MKSAYIKANKKQKDNIKDDQPGNNSQFNDFKKERQI